MALPAKCLRSSNLIVQKASANLQTKFCCHLCLHFIHKMHVLLLLCSWTCIAFDLVTGRSDSRRDWSITKAQVLQGRGFWASWWWNSRNLWRDDDWMWREYILELMAVKMSKSREGSCNLKTGRSNHRRDWSITKIQASQLRGWWES